MLSENASKRLGFTSALIADVMLVIGLIRLRSLRIAGNDASFFSVEFIGLAILAAILSLFAIWVVKVHWIHQYLSRMGWLVRLMAAGLIVLGLRGALALTVMVIPSVERYLLPYEIWLFFFSLALFMLLLTQRGDERASNTHWFARNWGRFSRVVVQGAVNILVPLLILEIGLRIWFGYFGTQNERIIYTYSSEDITRAAITYQGIPYLNYGLTTAHANNNSLGYRGPEIAVPKPEGIFRIVAMGGSTTYNGNVEKDETYSAQLERILREEYGYTNVEVVNAGVPSYTTWEALVNLEFRVLDLEPDLILLYQGLNDLAPRVFPPEYYRGLSPSAGLWRTSLPSLSPSVLYRFIAYNLGWMDNPRDLRSQMLPQFPELDCCTLLSDEVAAERFKLNPPIYYERNLRNIIAVAQTNNVNALFSTFVYFPDETSIPSANTMLAPYRQAALGEHNDVVREIASDTGMPMYDLAANFPYDQSLWTDDGVHMTAPGLLEQAEQYAAFIVEQELVSSPNP